MTQTAGSREPRRSKPPVVSIVLLGAVLCAAPGLIACGQDAQDSVVARIGGSAIRQDEVGHWAHAIGRGATPGNALGLSLGGSRRSAALGFLILAKWLTGEAAAEGAAVSRRAVQRRVDERIEVGGDEFKRGLESAGLTVADAKLEIEVELAVEAIGRMLAKRASAVTPREVIAFYRHNLARFRLAELRQTELIEGLPSRAVAFALVRRTGAGARFTERVTNYETLLLEPVADGERAAVLHAIFTARQGVAGVMRLDRRWAAFVVRRIFPARLLAFAEARAAAAAALVMRRQRRLTAEFLEAYRRRGIAETDCRSGYIVRWCRQYAGPPRPEPDPFSDG